MVFRSREKGSRAELEVANMIKLWWNAYEPTALFIRTPLSGGWQTNTGAAAYFNACGDLMTTSQTWPFCVEVKHREGWSIDFFLKGKDGPPWRWWEQCVEAAQKQNHVPMMWMRRNRIHQQTKKFPWLVLVPEEFAKLRSLDLPDIRWDFLKLVKTQVDPTVRPVGFLFDRFLNMSPERMIGKDSITPKRIEAASKALTRVNRQRKVERDANRKA